MRKGSVPFLVALVVVLAFVAARIPALMSSPDATERAHAGAGRHLVLHQDARPDAFRRDAPLATLVASLPLALTSTPSEPWDPAGPADQVGWIALHETRPAADVPALPPWQTALLTRALLTIASGAGVLLLLKIATRFYEPRTALLAGLVVAATAGLAWQGSRATPAGLAIAASALLVGAFDDHARAMRYDGRPPTWLGRNRAAFAGLAVGVALATSVAFLPFVVTSLVWLVARRGAARRRDERVQPGAAGRLAVGTLIAVVTLWLPHLALWSAPVATPFRQPGDAAAFVALGLSPPTDLPAMPAALWLGALLHAIADAAAAPPALAEIVAAGGPVLAALLALSIPAWNQIRRDRIDLPALLLALGWTGALTALVAAPRHVPVAVIAAIVPLSVLVAAWIVRLLRHARLAAVGALVVVGAGLGTGWALRSTPAASAPAPSEQAPADQAPDGALRPTEAWLLRRYLVHRAPGVVHTVLGREQIARITGTTHVIEHPPRDASLTSVVEAIGRAEPVALIVGEWLLRDDSDEAPTDLAVALGAREPTERLGRLLVFRPEY